MKYYYLCLIENDYKIWENFRLCTFYYGKEICSGKLSEIGLKYKESDYLIKLKDYLKKKYSIEPDNVISVFHLHKDI